MLPHADRCEAHSELRFADPISQIEDVGDMSVTGSTMASGSSRSIAMELTAVLTHAEEGGYVALNPETGTTTQGETVEEAVANLQEATALYLSEFPMPATGHPVVAPTASLR